LLCIQHGLRNIPSPVFISTRVHGKSSWLGYCMFFELCCLLQGARVVRIDPIHLFKLDLYAVTEAVLSFFVLILCYGVFMDW